MCASRALVRMTQSDNETVDLAVFSQILTEPGKYPVSGNKVCLTKYLFKLVWQFISCHFLLMLVTSATARYSELVDSISYQ